MEELSNEVIFEIGIKLPLKDIFNLCRANRCFNLLFCKSESYWRGRFIQDFGDPGPCLNWKDFYRYYANVYVFGTVDGDLAPSPGETHYNELTLIPGLKAKAAIAGYNRSFIINLNDEVTVYGDVEESPLRLSGIKAKDISNKMNHIAILDTESAVWTFGSNRYGQLGLGYANPSIDPEENFMNTPTRVFIGAQAIATGGYHTLILDIEGSVWSFGGNGSGELGFGDYEDRHQPTRLPLPIRVKAISAGISYSVILDSEGGVWVFGNNFEGQLPLDEELNPTPIKLSAPIHGKDVSAGGSHTVIIDEDSTLWVFGDNSEGQLLVDPEEGDVLDLTHITDMKAKKVSAGGFHTLIIDLEDRVWNFGEGKETGKIEGIKAKNVSAGLQSSFILALPKCVS